RTFPMDLRPQGPEIIRTWLFSTLLRSQLEHGELPWAHASINGWILDPDRKKMSKSKGNVVTPTALLEEFGSDAVRYWACNGRPGTDTALDTGVMKIGRRLAIKVLNASKFALGRLGDGPVPGVEAVRNPLDIALLSRLASLVESTTAAHESFDYARALELTESFFWSFCDDYVELVKARAYGEADPAGTDSARATLALALSVLHRLFAPFLPFVTEEVWSWWQEGSVHLAAWPDPAEVGPHAGAEADVLNVAAEVLGAVRREKTANKRSMRARVARLVVSGLPQVRRAVQDARGDIVDAGGVDELMLAEAADLTVVVTLADET
ncbi:MAG TPA: class I tRNA ligase family protein, partial [Acidimicrobiales bacterium]|nr:class I tRNA ligase family protein [Acidimicrobiales bacterium]